ncbi:MAG: HAMP domain-containing sensor histidine kinase [Vicinamibacterales bacterium]
MKARSLHARLVAGVIVWALGVLGASFAGMTLISRKPGWVMGVHFAMPIIAGLVFMGAGLLVVRRGLSPFRTLRERLAAVRDGRTARLEGEYPIEVEPLVADLNALLDERERRVARALATAGDLAHGLKTPLAILAQETGRADAAGQHDLAVALRDQVQRMRRQVDSHLAQARVTAAGAPSTASTRVIDAAHGIVRTMDRLYTDRALTIELDIPADSHVNVPLEDLEEMLGNLLDNACKWARTRVFVSSRADGRRVLIEVDDDGPGLEPGMRERVLQRGVRADEAPGGSGLGLAIVRDLAEVYRGSIVVDRSDRGGLRARLTLPSACQPDAPTLGMGR